MPLQQICVRCPSAEAVSPLPMQIVSREEISIASAKQNKLLWNIYG